MTLGTDDCDLARSWLSDRARWSDLQPVKEYEAAFALWNGSRAAFSFMGGRVALSAAIYALNLRPGDEVVVSLRGQENNEYRVLVDRDGRVALPRLSPISAAGRTLGDFRQDLINTIHRAYEVGRKIADSFKATMTIFFDAFSSDFSSPVSLPFANCAI